MCPIDGSMRSQTPSQWPVPAASGANAWLCSYSGRWTTCRNPCRGRFFVSIVVIIDSRLRCREATNVDLFDD